jgi:hypothetical protein
MKLWTQGSRIFVLDGNGLSIREKGVVIQVSTLGLSDGFVRGNWRFRLLDVTSYRAMTMETLPCGIQHAAIPASFQTPKT